MAADIIDSAAGPNQGPEVKLVITDRYKLAVDWRSTDSPSQAAAAASSGPDPGPAYMRVELISGGSDAKSISFPSPSSGTIPGHRLANSAAMTSGRGRCTHPFCSCEASAASIRLTTPAKKSPQVCSSGDQTSSTYC